MPIHLEINGHDTHATHVIVSLNNKPIGCARIRSNTVAKLERIAILTKYQQKGYGAQLMNYLITYCRERQVKEISLHSQTYIVDFYKKFGFNTRGTPFFEAGIEHIDMYRKP